LTITGGRGGGETGRGGGSSEMGEEKADDNDNGSMLSRKPGDIASDEGVRGGKLRLVEETEETSSKISSPRKLQQTKIKK
jgi:hypothetical protein